MRAGARRAHRLCRATTCWVTGPDVDVRAGAAHDVDARPDSLPDQRAGRGSGHGDGHIGRVVNPARPIPGTGHYLDRIMVDR